MVLNFQSKKTEFIKLGLWEINTCRFEGSFFQKPSKITKKN